MVGITCPNILVRNTWTNNDEITDQFPEIDTTSVWGVQVELGGGFQVPTSQPLACIATRAQDV